MRRFLKRLGQALKPATTARDARRASPQLEALEDRQLLSGFATNIHPALPPVIFDPIKAEYAATANERDTFGRVVQTLLGAPTSGEVSVPGVPGARMETYQGGTIYWSAASGPAVVYGAIGGEYGVTASEKDAYGTVVQKVLGLPTSDETNVPGVAGAREQTFQGGTIYWSAAPGVGAHAVYGAIGAKYAQMGGPAAYGLPIRDEGTVPNTHGVRFVNFQNGGSIYWSDATKTSGAHAVYGAINAEYLNTANETDAFGRDVQALLGAPVSDEVNVFGVPGAREVTFNNGAIYWSPSTGAHVIYGAIFDYYAYTLVGPTTTVAVRGSRVSLGLPTSDEVTDSFGDRVVHFQSGAEIHWSPQRGAFLELPYK
jgi:uncharacterized protein with LGFP repeats